jgi:hypothetical protein
MGVDTYCSDEGFPLFHRFPHFGKVGVEVVGFLHLRASGDVIDQPLRDVGTNFQPAEVGPECPA